jgi:hypothetical protein
VTVQQRRPSGTPAGGQFAAHAHAEPELSLDAVPAGASDELRAEVDRLAQYGSVPTGGHLQVLLPHERASAGGRMQTFCKDWAGFLSDPQFMATCKVVTAKDGAGLVTGQTSVHADVLLEMPDDIEDRIAAGETLSDAWDPLPVVLKIGRRKMVRDGHHRMMRKLLVGEPVRYRYVTEADLLAWQQAPAA